MRPLLKRTATLLAIITALTTEWQCSSTYELPPGDPDNGGLFLPDGFEAFVVVDSLRGRARHIAVRDNGDIYVKARFPREGGNIALRDTTGDGRADLIIPFGNYPPDGSYGTAMRIHNGYIYYSSQLVVYRSKLIPGQLLPDTVAEPIVIDDHPHGSHEHIAKPIAFDADGYLYVPFGAPSNNCQQMKRTPYSPGIDPCPTLEDHGGIWRFSADKPNQTQRDGKLFATGLRSIVAIEWHPTEDVVYTVQHGRDDLRRLWPNLYSAWASAELPSEELFRVTEGMHGGWPYCYYDQVAEKKVLAPEYGGDGTEVAYCDRYEKPVIGFPGHWAPNDILFYRGNQFPERYRNGAFIAFHGSTNRGPYPQAGYCIAFVPFENGRLSNRYEIFADGFAGVDPIVNVRDAEFRPMGLSEGPDGSLYIADTEKGRIWRIVYKGDKRSFGPAQLAGMEQRRRLSSNLKQPHITEDLLEKDFLTGGAQLYETYCTACHQRDGKGASGRFPPLARSPWVTGDKNLLISIVLKGMEGPMEVEGELYNGTMPQHSFLSDAEVATLLTYIRQNFGNNASDITPEDVGRIRQTVMVSNK